jgi:acyl-CoA synthetase (AMP-forming)/AMP-acid ligase II
VVVARGEDHEKFLAAYVVVEPCELRVLGTRVTDEVGSNVTGLGLRLRAFLKARLPNYLVPATVVMLDKLPLTANGTVDRRKLPVLEERSELLQAYMEACLTDREGAQRNLSFDILPCA